jgi:hypothetical protein
MKINPVTYQLKSDNLTNDQKKDDQNKNVQNKDDQNKDKHYGFIAQELEEMFPDLVQYNSSLNCQTINYLELIPLIICKMQKMQNQIDELLNSKN